MKMIPPPMSLSARTKSISGAKKWVLAEMSSISYLNGFIFVLGE
jgi:hypothetical protein